MASIVKRERKNKAPTFQAQIRMSGEKPIIRTFDTEQDAKDFVALVEAKLRDAKPAPAAPAPAPSVSFNEQRFEDVIRAFINASECSDRDQNIGRAVILNVGDVKLGELRKPYVRGYIAKMLKKTTRRKTFYQPSTIAAHMQLMNKVLRSHAEDMNVDLPPSPFSKTLLPTGWDRQRDRRLEAGEYRALIREINSKRRFSARHWRLLIRLAIETAARQQELALATWDEFDIDMGIWRIPAKHTKTKTARIVALSQNARRCLRLLNIIRNASSERVFYCFTGADSICSGFYKIRKAAGLVDFRFHDLRHEAISRMVLNNRKVSPFIIMKMVGHKSSEMLSRYTNLTASDLSGLFG